MKHSISKKSREEKGRGKNTFFLTWKCTVPISGDFQKKAGRGATLLFTADSFSCHTGTCRVETRGAAKHIKHRPAVHYRKTLSPNVNNGEGRETPSDLEGPDGVQVWNVSHLLSPSPFATSGLL